MLDVDAQERKQLDFKTFFAENKQAMITKLQMEGAEGAAEDPILPQGDLLNMTKYKKLTNLAEYRGKAAVSFRNVDLCIHSEYDIFGYQELMSDDAKLRCQHSVTCLQPDSVVYSIAKQYMAKHIRGNPSIYYALIDKWDELVRTRVMQSLIVSKALNGPAEVKDRLFMDPEELNEDRLAKQAHNEKIMNAVQDKLDGGD